MDAALFQRFSPEEYYRRFLADGVRPDGRVPHERRPAMLRHRAITSAQGSSSVRLGLSAAVAGITTEICEALPEQRVLGRIEVSVELPPLCSSIFRDKQRVGSMGTFLTSSLGDVLNSPHIFDASQLSITEEYYWVLNLHIICLNYDGNAFDLCLLAALAALEDLVLPALVKDKAAEGRGGQPRLAEDAPGRTADIEACKVALLSRPLPVTFAQLPGGQWVLDPSAAEEGLGASVSLCFCHGRWLVYHQGGGANAERFLSELMPVARLSVTALTDLLDGKQADPIL